jgi:hypothetical protein
MVSLISITRHRFRLMMRRRASLALEKKGALGSSGTFITRNGHRVWALKSLKLLYSPVAKAGNTSQRFFCEMSQRATLGS